MLGGGWGWGVGGGGGGKGGGVGGCHSHDVGEAILIEGKRVEGATGKRRDKKPVGEGGFWIANGGETASI